MGVGVQVKCPLCDFEAEILPGLGESAYFHEFQCKKCRDYFSTYIEADINRFFDILWVRYVWLGELIWRLFYRRHIKCTKCGSSNVKEILEKDISEFYDYEKEILNIRCPRCYSRLKWLGDIDFD